MRRYSVKPGRGPSAFGAFGGIIGAAFGVLWTIFAIALTSQAPNEPPFNIVKVIFPLFGVIFVIASIGGAIYNAHNASGRNRFSNFDVVPSDSEPEPMIGRPTGTPGATGAEAGRFCTNCGNAMRPTDKFCGQCGNRAEA